MGSTATLHIDYCPRTDAYEFFGDVKGEAVSTLIETWVQSVVGAGADDSPPEKRDVYRISITWFPEDDTFRIQSNTGNKGLRDGILMRILSLLEESEAVPEVGVLPVSPTVT